MIEIDFWNGNRSVIRQRYEREILDAFLSTTVQTHGVFTIKETLTDYSNSQESRAFGRYYNHIVEKLGLEKRTLIVLENPLIPKEFAKIKPNLSAFKLN